MGARIFLSRVGVILIAIALWEGLILLGYIPTLFVAPPSQIVLKSFRLFHEDPIVRAFWVTALETMVAFGISVALGIGIGAPIGLNSYLYRVFHPVLVLAFSMPQVVIFPLFLRFFGIGINSKIAFGVSHGFFPIAFIMSAICRGMFTGFRLGMGLTLLGVLLAELFVSQEGVGHFINLFTESFKSGELFAMITILSLIAVIINEVLRAVERRLSLWSEM